MPLFFLIYLAVHLLLASPAAMAASGPGAILTDDLNFAGLGQALEASCRYYDSRPRQEYSVCGRKLTAGQLARAYRHLISQLAATKPPDIEQFLADNFQLCPPTSLLVTGYYSPVVRGSLQPTATYRYPIYGLPGNHKLRSKSRAHIEGDSSLLADHALAYLADPLDVFFLHVQGSGLIELAGGRRLLAAYAGDNGHPYRSIGALLVREGKLSREEVSLATIRRYLVQHPQEQERILNHNERYIFFRLSSGSAASNRPRGSLGLPLTSGRSAAMDGAHYPPAILGLLSSRLPHIDESGQVRWRRFRRLVTHHDSGAAISGPHRLDLYIGQGDKAGSVAGLMKEKGNFAILIPNLSFPAVHSKILDSLHAAGNLRSAASLTQEVENNIHETDGNRLLD